MADHVSKGLGLISLKNLKEKRDDRWLDFAKKWAYATQVGECLVCAEATNQDLIASAMLGQAYFRPYCADCEFERELRTKESSK